MSQFVVFNLDDKRYGIRLSAVIRVVHAVQITPLPKAPAIIMGVINLRGLIIPVVNLRHRFHLPERGLELTDQLIVARASRSDAEEERGPILALIADAVVGVHDLSAEETTAADRITPGLEYLKGIAKTGQGMVLIHDLATFLSLEETKTLNAILPDGSA